MQLAFRQFHRLWNVEDWSGAMPVIECACGMVMSVMPAEPRLHCIRCGGAEFQAIGLREQASAAPRPGAKNAATDFGWRTSAPLVTSIGGLLESIASITLIK